MRVSRCLVPLVIVLAIGASACGSGAPSRDEFIADVQKTASKDFSSALAGTGISTDKASKLLEDFAGCVYDKIKDDTAELKAISDGGGDAALNKALDGKAAVCTEEFTKSLISSAGAGSAPTSSGG